MDLTPSSCLLPQGKGRGKGGVSLETSLAPPADIYFPAGRHMANPHAPAPSNSSTDPEHPAPNPTQRERLPREDGTDIGISSPVPLSDEAVGVISKLRRMKDEDEDYSRWRDVIFRAKNAEAMSPSGSMAGRSEGLDARASRRAKETAQELNAAEKNTTPSSAEASAPTHSSDVPLPHRPSVSEPRKSDRQEPATSAPPSMRTGADSAPDGRYCPECYLPLQPDPRPEKLFIFLHAWRYTTKEWTFKTEMPFWAAKNYRWNQSAPERGVIAASKEH